MVEHFGLDDDDLPADAYPLHYKLIAKEQNKDRNLFKLLKSNTSGYTIKSFCGSGKKRDLICHNDKIVIPSSLQKRVVEWYHTTWCHPGETRTEQTIRQHFTWTRLRQDVAHVCGRCHTCQITKKAKKKYGHLPPKEAEAEPWEKLCMYLIGPYTIKRPGKKTLPLWCVPYALAKTKRRSKRVCEIIVNTNLKCINCKVRSYLLVLARQLGGWPVLYTVHS